MDSEIKEALSFIELYFSNSQKRGPMYGSIEQLESNWILLNKIKLILIGKDINKFDYPTFLQTKGFGAKSASTKIKEENLPDPYSQLNEIWNQYIRWRDSNN